MDGRTATLAMTIGLGVLAGTARAQPIGETEAIRRALERSRELQMMLCEEASQQRGIDAAATGFKDPQLRLEDLSTRYFDPDANHQFTLGLRWSPPRIGELDAAAQEERVELWKRKVKTGEVRARIAADARKAFAGQSLLGELDELARRRVELEEGRLASIEALVALGERTVLDRAKAMRRLAKARRDAARVAQRRAEGRERFEALTGVPGDAALVAVEAPEGDLDLDAIRRAATGHRPEVGLAQQRTILADREWAAERFRVFPWISFVEVGFVHETEKTDWGEMRLGIDLPFSRWNLARLRAAAVRQRAGVLAAAATDEAIDRDVRSALQKYREALAAVRSLREDRDRQGRQADEVLQAARADRTLAADDVADLELADLDERQVALEARYDLAVAAADLCAAAGVESFADLSP